MNTTCTGFQRKLWLGLVIVVLLPTASSGQIEPGQFQLIEELQPFQNRVPTSNLAIRSQLRLAPDGRFGVVEITATMDPKWHIYSLTQPPGGPMTSSIKLDMVDGLRLLGSFAPDRPPKVHYVDVFKMDVEEFPEAVTWSVPVERMGSDVPVGGHLNGQVCADDGACVPISASDSRFDANPGESLDATEAQNLVGTRLKNTHGDLRGWASARVVTPGQTVMLHFSMTPDDKWHVYAYELQPPSIFQRPTLVHVTPPEGWQAGPVRSAAPIVSEASPIPGEPPTRYYDGSVTWTLPIDVPASATPGQYKVTGHLALQTCAQTCDQPTAVAWSADLLVGSERDTRIGQIAFATQPTSYDAVVALIESGAQPAAPNASDVQDERPDAPGGFDPTQLKVASGEKRSTLFYLASAFVGGFILNFMPCVLPVIGLKIMSFVDQAGANRWRTFGLNLWYAFGMLAVFWVLATLAAAPALGLSDSGLGWGEQNNYDGFSISLICLVFVMGLSFLGVWEIPIPGFATSSKATELAEQGGVSGAFFKGAITTLLATPCSAPGLLTAYGWAVQTKSPTLSYLVFTLMGLGMALPYLIIGAFPGLIRFLPKPGAWMDTFKQLMGFLLLGTVVFLLTNVDWQNLVPTISLLFGLWFACWWIGRVPLTANIDRRLRAWAVSAVIAMVSLAISFSSQFDAFGMSFQGLRGRMDRKLTRYVDHQVSQRLDGGGDLAVEPVNQAEGENELPWETYSDDLLKQLTAGQQTVMVDFTADW